MQELKFLKVVKFFLEHPYEEVYLRQLAKKLDLSTFAVKKYADLLLKEHLIIEERKANLRYFRANVNSLFFKYLKIAFSINLIIKSGLIDFIKKNVVNISSIVLFGSIAKGEDNEQSDVDVLVIGKGTHISLLEFEKKLGREINMHVLSWSEWNENAEKNKAFYFEIITYGIQLYGEVPVVKWK